MSHLLLLVVIPVFLPMEPRSAPYGRPLLWGHFVIVIVSILTAQTVTHVTFLAATLRSDLAPQ
jgi:hypothetical protein